MDLAGRLANRMVLVRLADQANDDGWCVSKYKTLERVVGLKRRAILASVAELEEAGLVRRASRFNEEGRQCATLFYVCVDGPVSDEELVELAEGTRFESAKSKARRSPTGAPDVHEHVPKVCSHAHPEGAATCTPYNEYNRFSLIDSKESGGAQGAPGAEAPMRTNAGEALEQVPIDLGPEAAESPAVAPTEEPQRPSKANGRRKASQSREKARPANAQEVAEYCRERGNSVDPDLFFDKHEAMGWRLKNGRPVKDWRAAVRTWERYQAQFEANAAASPVAPQAKKRRILE